jgi:hypothetical protein
MVDIVQPGVYLTLDTKNADIVFLSYKLWTDTYSTTDIIVHTGAVKINDKWIGVNTKWFGVNTVDANSLKTFIEDRKGDLDHVLLWDFSSASTKTDQFPSSEQQTKRSYLYLFYTTIFEFYKDFLTANPADKKNFFKGRTKGSAIESPPGLVLKALKTGFEILGVKSDSGIQFSAYKKTDIEPYVRTHKTIAERIFPTGDFNWGEKVTARLFLFNPPIFDDRFIIKAYKVASSAPLPAPRRASKAAANPATLGFAGQAFVQNLDQEEHALYDADIQQKFNAVTTKPASEKDLYLKQEIELMTKDLEKYAGSRNENLIRVTAYGFRADTRSPVQVRVDGGFAPNATRDDRRKLAELPHAERMAQKKPVIASPDSILDNLSHQATWGSDYSGYVSFAKNPAKTMGFVPKKPNSTAWIYVVKCRDAIDVAKSFHQPRYKENEISVAGGVEWEDIVGWRRIEYNANKANYRWTERFFYLSTDIIKLPKSPTGFDPENKYKRVKDTLSTDPW